MIRNLLLCSTILLSACTMAADRPALSPPAPAPVAAVDQNAALAKFFAGYDAAALERSPTEKTDRGIRDEDYGEWDDFSDAGAILDHQADQEALAELHRRFDPAKLDPPSQLSFRLFESMIARRDRAFAFRDDAYVFDQMNGAQSELPAFLINLHLVTNKAEAEAYVRRLGGLGKAIDQSIALSKARAAKGVMPPKWVYPYVISDARNVVTGAPFGKGTDAPLYADLKMKVARLAIPQSEKDAIIAAGAKALVAQVQPAYARLVTEMQRQEKLAGTDDGVWRLKDGADFYAERLAYYTTTDYTPDQVYQIGLDQVARVQEEMRGVMRQVGFKGDLPAFFKFMRTDKRFFQPNTPAGRAYYLSETEKAKQAVTALLPQWFGVLPRAALVVKPVEPFREQSAGKAFYQSPAPDGSRPGVYYVNLYDMADMPTTEIEALFYHEGIPGHHLQLSIQTELKDVPAFRQFGSYTAYVEGWGLYAEKLGKDMGLYKNPYRNFGRLALELHRAIRLVVDSGIHHKHWTREQAIQYVVDNSPDTRGSATKAIERYIIYPGQATAYMIGRLKISALRDKAQGALGDRFDVRGFHDVVLGGGPVPLDVLEQRVNAWITSRKPDG